MDYRLNDKKKLMFFSQLQVLLRSGLGFSRSFALVIEGAESKDKEVLSSVFENVIAGKSLWEAVCAEKSFSRLDSGVIRIGEETGRLQDALDFLSRYYTRKEEQRRMIVNALSYPAITLCVAAAVLIFMLLVVVPMFQQVYARMGSDLPGITKTIIRFSEMAPTIILCFAASAGVVFISKRLAGDYGKYQQAVSSVILKLPVAGELVKKYQMSRICSLMHLMTSSGVPVLQALKLLSGIMTFYPFRESILHLCKTIEKGGSLADGISGREHLYGKKFAVLIRIGEETGSLESMFRSQAEDTAAELEFGIRQMNNVLEPALILCIGAIVAFVLIAMYMPMFKLGMTIR